MSLNAKWRALTGITLLAALVIGFAPEQANAQRRLRRPRVPRAQVTAADRAQPPRAVEDPRFSADDREIMRVYYKTVYWQQGGGVWPIRANFGGSAAAGQSSIERGIALPRAVRQLFKPFPAELEQQLQPLPKNCARGWVNYDVVIINVLSHRVTDVIHDFLRSGVEARK